MTDEVRVDLHEELEAGERAALAEAGLALVGAGGGRPGILLRLGEGVVGDLRPRARHRMPGDG